MRESSVSSLQRRWVPAFAGMTNVDESLVTTPLLEVRDLSVFYVDHEILPSTKLAYERHRALRAAAQRRGVFVSRPGNGEWPGGGG